jgi:hypothetical protein
MSKIKGYAILTILAAALIIALILWPLWVLWLMVPLGIASTYIILLAIDLIKQDE